MELVELVVNCLAVVESSLVELVESALVGAEA